MVSDDALRALQTLISLGSFFGEQITRLLTTESIQDQRGDRFRRRYATNESDDSQPWVEPERSGDSRRQIHGYRP